MNAVQRRLATLAAVLAIAACDDHAAPPAPAPVAPRPKEAPKPATDADSGRAPAATAPTDPRTVDSERKKDWVQLNPVFKDFEMTSVFADPYVIFQQIKKGDVRETQRTYDDKSGETLEVPSDGTVNPAKVLQNRIWAEKGGMLVRRNGVLLCELNRRFRELFAARFKLPTLQEKGRILTGVVMWNRQSFDKLLADAGQPVGPGVRAFYSPPQQKFFSYVGDGAPSSADQWTCADGHVQRESDQALCWVGTQQLVHEYSAIFQGRPLSDDQVNVVPRRDLWFERGLAAFMSAVEVDARVMETLDGATWFHNRIRLDLVDRARRSRAQFDKWTIADLLKPRGSDEVSASGEKLSPGEGAKAASQFNGRAWAFCHFLWHYDGGRYRNQFLDCFELVLRGAPSSEKFAVDVMKRPSAGDWGDVEMEFDWYCNQLLNRDVGKNPATREPHAPETSPPTGRAQDDVDFCAAWKESHSATKSGEKR